MQFFLGLLETGFGTAIALGVIYLAILVVKWRTHEQPKQPVKQQPNPFDEMVDSGIMRVPELVSKSSCDAFQRSIKMQIETIGRNIRENDYQLKTTIDSLQDTVGRLDKTVAVLEDRENRKRKIDE